MIYHIQKDSRSLDDQTPPKMFDLYQFSLVGEASDPEVEFVTPVTPGGSVKFLPVV